MVTFFCLVVNAGHMSPQLRKIRSLNPELEQQLSQVLVKKSHWVIATSRLIVGRLSPRAEFDPRAPQDATLAGYLGTCAISDKDFESDSASTTFVSPRELGLRDIFEAVRGLVETWSDYHR